MYKKVLALMLSVVLAFSLAFSASAATEKVVWSPYIKVDDVVATANDTVLVNLELTGNTHGIMAITISVIYDKDVLSYQNYYNGVFTQHYVSPKDGYVAIVDCENKSIKKEGPIITLEFKVKEDAHGGTYPIKIGHVRPKEKGENLKDCFANWRGDVINPIVTNGSITVPLTQQNCRHSFSEWKVKAAPSCTKGGAEERNCSACGKNEIRETEKIDHIYDSNWTIVTAATKDNKGSMARLCDGCGKKTDTVYYPFSLVEETNFKNTVGDTVTSAEKAIADNYKGVEQTPSEKDPDKPDTPETPPEQDNPDADDIPDANTIVSDIREEEKSPNGISGNIYCYLFGEDGKGGIINAIIKAFKQFINDLF